MAMYLVTGGAGFIGSHLATALLAAGHSVRVVDNLATGRRDNLPRGVEFLEGDLADPAVATAAVQGCEVVLHQAAIPSVPRSIADPRPSHDANVNATLNVLLASRDNGVRRVVYAASSSAYGDTAVLPKVEEMPTNPLSPYGLQKQVGEAYCRLFTRLYGLETVSIRYFNVFGPRQQASSPYSGVVSLLIKAALAGIAPTIHGDGLQTRDFTFIDNVVDGVLRAIDAPAAAGEVINVACGQRVSLLDVWRELDVLLGPLPTPVFTPPRPGDVRDSQADIGKAERLLGYRPSVPFAEGLRRTVEWTQGIAVGDRRDGASHPSRLHDVPTPSTALRRPLEAFVDPRSVPSQEPVGQSRPNVTVYVVNCNYGRYLLEAIESVLAQDHSGIDIVVVDDASTDDSAAILGRFEQDPRIRIIRQHTRRGLTACCNAALRVARGDMVMRLDADDALHPSAVGKLAAVLQSDPQAVLVFPDYVEVDGRGAVIRHVKRHDLTPLEALSDLPAHGACTLARRSFLERMGGYDEAIPCQDGLDVWLNVTPPDRVLQIGEPLFSYRKHGSNLTRDERALLKARTRLFAKHVAMRGLPRPRILAVVPVRGQVVDPGSQPLRILGARPLIDWTLDEALACARFDRVVVSSPDSAVLDHVGQRHGPRVGLHRRSLESAGLNISVANTVRDVLLSELDDGRPHDAVAILTVESPFRSRLFMEQAVDVMQLFAADSVTGVRHEDEAFYHHDGLGLEPVRGDERMRLERDDLFRASGGLRLISLPPPDVDREAYLAACQRRPSRLGHVLLDQLAAVSVRSPLDWEIARHLAATALEESGRA